MAMFAKVRRMRHQNGLSISEIAQRTSLSRNTVKTLLREPVRSETRYQREASTRKIDGVARWLRQALETDSHRRRSERRTELKLFQQIRDQGYDGGYTKDLATISAANSSTF